MSGRGKFGMIVVTFCVLLLLTACASDPTPTPYLSVGNAYGIPKSSSGLPMPVEMFDISIGKIDGSRVPISITLTNTFEYRMVAYLSLRGTKEFAIDPKGFSLRPDNEQGDLFIWELFIPPDEHVVLDMIGVLSKSAVEQAKRQGFMEMKSFEMSVSYNLVQESPVER